jgi:hypothetical protein
MAIVKKAPFNSSVYIRDEDALFLSKEAKKERWGLLPGKTHVSPGDDQDCVGCPIWIRWACIKCGTCMYWVEDE